MNYRLERALRGDRPDQVPFLPAIYEHKAWFVGKSPSSVARDARLLTEALFAEYEQVRPDALTIGIDVYNVEAEAIGCSVTYHDDNSVPAITADGAMFQDTVDVASLRKPDPHRSGRMPLHLEVAENIVEALGGEIPIRAAVSGPFSLAAHLAGAESFLMLTRTDPATAIDLLLFASEVIREYGMALIAKGCGVIMFDSHASPDVISPRMYREIVLPPTKSIIASFHEKGISHVPLIVGGDTTPILEAYLETGANNILCDATADAGKFLDICTGAGRAFRRNIDASDVLQIAPDEVYSRAMKCLNESRGYPGFILGSAVVPYGTLPSHLAAMREAIREYTAMGFA